MQNAKTAVSRIEFRTNLMRADAPVVPLGFMVECCWDDARWLGVVYRPTLTANELREINLLTWPEMSSPEGLLRGMFDRAWSSADGSGGAALAAEYGGLNALHVFVEDGASDIAAGVDIDLDDSVVEQQLYSLLKQFEERLEPTCAAEIIMLPSRGRETLIRVDHKRAAA